ncbi:MAG TPA: hypothetical protein VGF29_04090 [Hyphomicrobiaceae bacterium]|jgi:hypothetical protein
MAHDENDETLDLAPLGLGIGISPSLMPTPKPVVESESARVDTPLPAESAAKPAAGGEAPAVAVDDAVGF